MHSLCLSDTCNRYLAIRDVYSEVNVAEGARSDFPHKPVLAADDELGLVDDSDDRHVGCFCGPATHKTTGERFVSSPLARRKSVFWGANQR